MFATEAKPLSSAQSAEPSPEAIPRSAADLVRSAQAVGPGQLNRDVLQVFKDYPDLAALPVVEDGAPIGIINRSIFLTGYSQPFHREVYERKSCIAFMDKSPLVVEESLSIADLGRLAAEAGAKALQDGFLVTRSGRYQGVGTGLDLFKALGRMEAERNRVIRESIAYAQIIQGAVLATSLKELRSAGLPDQHLLWQPRDQVGGDAFFARRLERDGRKGTFLALMDCTGHGVPGAFTAMLMTSFLGHALEVAAPWEPGQVLAEVNRRVKAELGQAYRGDDLGSFGSSGAAPSADEGMDATCLWIGEDGGIVFAGAKHSLWVFAQGSHAPEEVKGDRIGVGYTNTPDDQAWTDRALAFAPGTVLLGTSDGVIDQIGGPKRIAFGKTRLWEAFLAGGNSLQNRLDHAFSAMAAYQGAELRRDDVCLLAIRL